MKIRKLRSCDAPHMLEWMHDETVVKYMKANFMNKKLEDCLSFIENAQNDLENLHMAIDDNGEYMGTVSLKHIRNGKAEFGITVRKCAMGNGYSKFGMEQIIKKGFMELGLKCIYWCVDPMNNRAIHFYDKNGYKRCKCPNEAIEYSELEKEKLIWYCIYNENYINAY